MHTNLLFFVFMFNNFNTCSRPSLNPGKTVVTALIFPWHNGVADATVFRTVCRDHTCDMFQLTGDVLQPFSRHVVKQVNTLLQECSIHFVKKLNLHLRLVHLCEGTVNLSFTNIAVVYGPYLYTHANSEVWLLLGCTFPCPICNALNKHIHIIHCTDQFVLRKCTWVEYLFIDLIAWHMEVHYPNGLSGGHISALPEDVLVK